MTNENLVIRAGTRRPSLGGLGIGLLLVAACGGDRTGSNDNRTNTPPSVAPSTAPVGELPATERVAVIEGFDLPESVRHHPESDLYFVSNTGEHPTRIDNNGFISRVRPDGTLEELRFIAGGVAGVTLNGPKGLRILGDTLWVADITVVRAFDANTGEALFNVDLEPLGAVFLNALDRGGDGAMYVTDSGLRFDDAGQSEHTGPDRIYRIAPDRAASVALESPALEAPNGIDWDERTGMFVVASRNGRSLWAWPLGMAEPVHLALGPSGYDGALSLPDGRVFASSWGAGDVQMLWSSGGLRPLISNLEQPADIGFDLNRNRLLIPLLGSGRVEVWQLR